LMEAGVPTRNYRGGQLGVAKPRHLRVSAIFEVHG